MGDKIGTIWISFVRLVVQVGSLRLVPEMSTERERTDERALDHVGRSFCDHYDWRIGITYEKREINQHF